MKYLLITAILLSTGGSALAQQDVKVRHSPYYRCFDHAEEDPHKAYEYCSDYLKNNPNDDKRLLDFAARFITAYTKISQYVKSVPMTSFTEVTPGWAVFSPGLLATIPSENIRHPRHPILIKREYSSPAEGKLLAKAESVYKNPATFEPELLKQWSYFAENDAVIPDGEPKWWTSGKQTVLAADVVTTEAVLYYYNISHALRSKAGKLKDNSFKFSSSRLRYDASIKKMDVYERAGRSFDNVYVANMTLTWAQVCGDLCGSGFTRNKIVVMSPSGEILGMFVDDPVNRMSWIS